MKPVDLIGNIFSDTFLISSGLIGLALLYINNDSIKTKWLRICANILPLIVLLMLILLKRWKR